MFITAACPGASCRDPTESLEMEKMVTPTLGMTAKDRITGYTGVVVGTCQYLTGCNQALLQPVGTDPSVRPTSEWFDVQRLQWVDATMVVLDNGATPGSDRAASKR